MHLSTLLQWAGIFGVLIAAAGIVGAAFRTSGNARALENYKSLAESYKMTNEDQAKRITAQDTEIADLRGKVETLTELVTGRAAYQQLADTMRKMNATQERMARTLDAIAVKVGAEGR